MFQSISNMELLTFGKAVHAALPQTIKWKGPELGFISGPERHTPARVFVGYSHTAETGSPHEHVQMAGVILRQVDGAWRYEAGGLLNDKRTGIAENNPYRDLGNGVRLSIARESGPVAASLFREFERAFNLDKITRDEFEAFTEDLIKMVEAVPGFGSVFVNLLVGSLSASYQKELMGGFVDPDSNLIMAYIVHRYIWPGEHSEADPISLGGVTIERIEGYRLNVTRHAAMIAKSYNENTQEGKK